MRERDTRLFSHTSRGFGLPLYQCDRFRLCRCHSVTNLATPTSLGNTIGRFFIGYVGVPLTNRRTCNRKTCRHGRWQTRKRIACLCPLWLWFALRLIALVVTKASTTFMWTLSFPAVTLSSCPMLVFTCRGPRRDRHDSEQVALARKYCYQHL